MKKPALSLWLDSSHCRKEAILPYHTSKDWFSYQSLIVM